MTRVPIIVLSYNRPELLEKVTSSMLQQTVSAPQEDLYLFQDGIDDDTAGVQQQCIDVFRRAFPGGTIFSARRNLGVALNYERAELFAFEVLDADYAWFFEDDLLLGKHYFEALKTLSEYALSNPKIAYAAAYGNYKSSLEQQHSNYQTLIPLDHKWGFVLTKRQWLRQKHIVDGYLKIVREVPYRERNHHAIRKYFQSLGYTSPGTSQDAAKDIASLVLGTVKINTFPCFGKYFGADGIHMNAATYEQLGYGETQLYDQRPEIGSPDSAVLDQWSQQQQAANRFDPKEDEFIRSYKLITGRELSSTSIRGQIDYANDPLAERRRLVSKPQLQGVLREVRLLYQIEALRGIKATAGPLKIVIGASGTNFQGWISTDQELLDLLSPHRWLAWLDIASVDNILAEHVWEHLDPAESDVAAGTCMTYLKPGGRIRVAVPDALHPDEEYRAYCGIGNQDGHKQFFTHETLRRLFDDRGFETQLLEWWDENGAFNKVDWETEDGYISRSSENDWRNTDGTLKYTSLILDAVKPLDVLDCPLGPPS